ncbi:uncharacterized protein LOC127120161 isoform X1 [Lathyrus oleraceus]|uniref:DDT domain-containing protein n=1 Tax=Pisum sativum TaxID=3888 RepID=A0A9D5BFC9_PEA|nr:uncharacterized protein LOC127120161 isoform X1 [Pisum sativum]KAI5442565.1 hypothetical protein KIW84_011566 [Pisum sativum]
MEIDSSPLQPNESEVDVGAKQVSRNNSRGVRVVGSRIYDSENGKSCHQCRQKTMDFSAACKNPKNGKPCTIRFCHKCLLNRYGEKAEEVDLLSDWMCPKCKGSCNCSICMKRKGQQPTGLLVHTAKKSGFNSVSEMLSKKASHDLEKELVVDLFGELGKDKSLGENKGLKVEKEKTKRMKQKKVKEISNGNNVNDACQNKILKKPKHSKGVSDNAVKINENAEMDTKVEGFAVDLFGEPEKENSLGRNNVENEKTKKMKRRKLKEISNGNNVDGACQKKMSKKPKRCNGVPENEVKSNENAEMETKVEEHLVVRSGEEQQKNSLGGNKGLKVVNAKTKKMKQKLNEISDGNNVEEACQKKILKRPKHCHGALDVEVKRNENAEMETKAEELVVDLSGEAHQKNSLDENKGLEDENVKTKEMKQKKLRELSNGNNVEGACQKNGEVKRSENAEMETKVEVSHGVIHVQMDAPLVMDEGDNASAKSKNAIILQAQKVKEEIPLPLGTEMTKVLDIEFALEDVGNALQFLEFCRVFGKALDVKKGEAGAILRTLIRKRNLRCGQNTLVVEFQIKLLTLIVSESDIESSSLTASNGKHSWLNVLKDLITESNLGLKEFPLDWLNKGISGYNELNLSKKLILLNFICDEALGTKKLRSYIDDQNAILTEEKKAARLKVAEAREKEKSLKQKLQDEMAKAVISNGGTFSFSEYDALLSKIKSESAKAHTELLEAKGTVPKWNQCCDAVRVDPEYLDNSGKTFWKFKSCNDEYSFLLQDLKIDGGDSAVQVDEKWVVYGDEQKDEVNKYISSRRRWLPKLASV